jgi:hypothetical protein
MPYYGYYYGYTGPQGAQYLEAFYLPNPYLGPQGYQGFQGATGPQGYQGATGSGGGSQDFDLLNNIMGTGLISGGGLSFTPGTTTFGIAAGTGVIVNNYTDPTNPVRTLVSWGTLPGLTDPYAATTDASFVAIDSNGSFQISDTDFTPDDTRDAIELGALGHSGGVIAYAEGTPWLIPDHAKTVEDFLAQFGVFNVDGNVYAGASGASGPYLTKTAGHSFVPGGNFGIDPKSPNITTCPSQGAGYLYFISAYQDGQGGWIELPPTPNIDPNHWDDGSGHLATVPDTYWTIQLLFHFPIINLTGLGIGQRIYDTLNDAKADIQNSVAINPIASRACFRGWLIVQKGATDLSNPNVAYFREAGKFGLATTVGTGTGGEANTASNAGMIGVGLVLPKSGVNLPFKSIAGDGTTIAVTSDGSHNAVVISGMYTPAHSNKWPSPPTSIANALDQLQGAVWP